MEPQLENVKECIVKYKVRDVQKAVQDALDAGIAPGRILDEGMVTAMAEVGEGFKNNTIFMPQMLMSAKAMQLGLEVLKPKLVESGGASSVKGTAIVGSVEGDVHDIGKNLVTVMLQGAGLDVIDLGTDVSTGVFIKTLEEHPDTKIVALSSTMTPTREALKDVVEALNKMPNRPEFAVFTGGATMDQEFSDEVGADVYTVDAASASDRAKKYLSGEPISQLSEESREIAEKEAAEKQAEISDAGEEKKGEAKVLRHLEPPAIRALREAGTYSRPKMSIWDNLQEWLKHDKGVPDSYLNQYFFDVLFDPVLIKSRNMQDEFFDPKSEYVDGWGVKNSIPKGSAGAHPMDGPGDLVITDITKWKEQVHAQPPTEAKDFPEKAWAISDQQYKAAQEAGRPVAVAMMPGLFERVHFLMGMSNALTAYYEHPKEMHELIDWIADWECRSLDTVMARYHAPILFHHDDWGTALNSFLDPDTHRDFFLKPVKRIYDHFRALGGKVVIHHSDSYAANLVPIWIDASVDIWQGAVSANNIPELIDKYGDRIMIMGGLDNATIDLPGFSDEGIEKYVRQRIKENGCHSYIPCLTRGLGFSIVPGVYDSVSKAIDKVSKETFGA